MAGYEPTFCRAADVRAATIGRQTNGCRRRETERVSATGRGLWCLGVGSELSLQRRQGSAPGDGRLP